MATEYEQRLRHAILRAIAYQGPEWPMTGDWKPERDELKEEQTEDWSRSSADEFTAVITTGLFQSERMYVLEVSADGLSSTAYTLVSTFYADGVSTPDKPDVLITRIKTISLFVEGATAVVYNAEYGEEGLEF